MTEIPQAALRARQMYVDGELLVDIQAETKLSLDRTYYWLDGGGGRLPPIARRRSFGRGEGKARARRALIGRMMRAAEHHMQSIEARMSSAGLEPAEQDRDARALAVLARTMRELTALDERNRPKRQADQSHDQPVPRDVEELRRSLSAKVEALIASQHAETSADDPG